MEIYTIGHSNHTIERFVEMLIDNSIKALVDVRSAPYSQYTPHFNKAPLEKSLEAHGIAYAFAGEYLGGRPKDPTCYRGGVVPSGDIKGNYLQAVDYEEVAKRDWYQRGIARLIEIAQEQRTAIMCSEEDPAHCHRQHLIANTLIVMGVAVKHIRANGLEDATALPKQMSLF